MSTTPHVAFLDYTGPWKQSRRKCNDLLRVVNPGVAVLWDALKRAKIEVGFCRPETARNYEVVLVSLASRFDVVNLLCSIRDHWRTWAPGRREFKVIMGGPGLQNPRPLLGVWDAAVFGRAEGTIAPLVGSLLDGGLLGRFEDESILWADNPTAPVRFGMAKEIYPRRLNLYTDIWQEREIGCKELCRYCQYTFTHTPVCPEGGRGGIYTAGKGPTRQVRIADLVAGTVDAPRVTTAIDGFSERIRFAFCKRITDDDIVEGLSKLSELRPQGSFVRLNVIGSVPTETPDDWDRLKRALARVRGPGRLSVEIRVMEFQAEPFTPLQWFPMPQEVDWAEIAQQPFYEGGIINAWYSRHCQGRWATFVSMLLARAVNTGPVLDASTVDVYTDALRLLLKGRFRGNHMTATGKWRQIQRVNPLVYGSITGEWGGDRPLPTRKITGRFDDVRLDEMGDGVRAWLGMD